VSMSQVRGRNGYTFLALQPEGKKPISRPKRVWRDNMTVCLTEIGWEVMN
jgi:hypothetical protein